MSFFHQNTEKRRDLILNGSISSTILFLSIPTLMMGLVQSLMPVVDSLYINNMIGTVAAGAITYSGPIINMFVAIATGLSVAGMALIGQMNGIGNFKEAKRVSTQIVVFAFVLGIIIAPLLFFVAFPVSKGVDSQIADHVFIYLSLNSLILPFYFLEAIYNAIKNAAGKPEATFIRMIIMLILKVLFNTLFIAILNWGVMGAIMSSILTHVFIGIWMFYELFIKDSEDKLIVKHFKFDFKVLRHLLIIGLPSIMNSLMLSLGFVLINNEIEHYGPIVLTATGIANSISSICFILPSAYGSAVTTMVSMNVGAGQGEKARASTIMGCIVSAITAIILIAIVVPLSPHLTTLFTKDPEVLAIANRSLSIYTYSVVGFGLVMVQQGAFIGLGRTKIPLAMGILRIWLLRYLFILLTDQYLGFYSVFWGNLFSNYMAAIITTILLVKVKWVSFISPKHLKQQAEPQIVVAKA